MNLLLKKRADCCCNNLFIIDEIAIMILDKYDRPNFCDIIFVYQYFENHALIFQNTSSITVI